MRLLLLGMGGQFTRIVLERLPAAGVEVCGLLLSGPTLRPLPLEPGPESGPLSLSLVDSYIETNALHIAWRAGIPVWESGPPAASALAAQVRQLAPDVACVACFDRIIPAQLLALPRHGFLNVHPSRLPAFRGPEPLFWQFRAGVNPVGVTVHWMDAGLDTGDIAAQRDLLLAEGVSGREAEALCAAAGGDLLVDVLGHLARANATRRPQPAGGSYQPAPTTDDFRLESGWHARRAFNFMRGTADWGIPYPFTFEGRELLLRSALGWEEQGASSQPDAPSIHLDGETVRIPFAQGVLVARLAKTVGAGTSPTG